MVRIYDRHHWSTALKCVRKRIFLVQKKGWSNHYHIFLEHYSNTSLHVSVMGPSCIYEQE